MGLKGAPGYFQQVLETDVLKGLIYKTCELYIDDLVIFAETQDDLVARLDTILERFINKGIVVSPKKCTFGVQEIEFLGHTVTALGCHFSREKLDKVLQVPPPNTHRELKSLLGVTVFFHDHIKGYSDLVRPLHELIRSYKPKNKIRWNDTAKQHFHDLIQAVNTCPMLYFMDDDAPIYLNTDASDYGIGAYLSQIIDGVEHPVYFISKSLVKEQLNWSVPEKECFAIWYALKKLDCEFPALNLLTRFRVDVD